MKNFLREHLEGVSLRLQPLYGARQGVEQLVFGAQRVVERDYRAVAGVAPYVQEHVAAVEVDTVVARYEVPHHNAVALLDEHILVPFHPAVRRAEQVGLQEYVCFVDVAHV